jgi:hypothetical protein
MHATKNVSQMKRWWHKNSDDEHLCEPKKEYLLEPTEHQDPVYVMILLNPPYRTGKIDKKLIQNSYTST